MRYSKTWQQNSPQGLSKTIEEHVTELRAFQTEMATISDQIANDETISEYVTSIAELEKQLSQRRDELHDLISGYGQDSIDERRNEIKEQIIDEWTGENKTMVFDAGTLKFRTTQRLVIENETLVLTGLLDHTSVKDVATNYIKGFNLAAVKKYMGVLDPVWIQVQ